MWSLIHQSAGAQARRLLLALGCGWEGGESSCETVWCSGSLAGIKEILSSWLKGRFSLSARGSWAGEQLGEDLGSVGLALGHKLQIRVWEESWATSHLQSSHRLSKLWKVVPSFVAFHLSSVVQWIIWLDSKDFHQKSHIPLPTFLFALRSQKSMRAARVGGY